MVVGKPVIGHEGIGCDVSGRPSDRSPITDHCPLIIEDLEQTSQNA